MMNFVVKTRNFVSKTRIFVSKTRNFVSKTRNFVFKMMNFAEATLTGALDYTSNPHRNLISRDFSVVIDCLRVQALRVTFHHSAVLVVSLCGLTFGLTFGPTFGSIWCLSHQTRPSSQITRLEAAVRSTLDSTLPAGHRARIMNFVFKTRNFVVKTRYFASKTRNFVVKTMNFAGHLHQSSSRTATLLITLRRAVGMRCGMGRARRRPGLTMRSTTSCT